MDLGVISVRYARALLKSALLQKIADNVYADMQNLYNSYLQVSQLRQTVDNPMLQKEQKRHILEVACGEDATPLVRRFLQLVLEDDRESTLQFMAASYITLFRKNKNIIRGKLTTAVPVSPETEDKMRKMVELKTNGTVELNTEVDPSIIGGFILEYDTYRLDASVKHKLQTILSQLKK